MTTPDGITPAERISLAPDLLRTLLAAPEGVPVRISDWPIAPGRRGRVVVTRRDVYAPDAKLYVVESAGVREVPRSSLAFLSGELEGDGTTRILVIVDPEADRLSGFVRTAEGWTELRRADDGASGEDYLLVPAADRPPFGCGVSELPKPPLDRGARAFPEDVTALRQSTIAFDTDNELMLSKFSNNVTSATNYVAQLVALMSVIYERDVQVRLLQGTTFYRVSTMPDPYVQSAADDADGNKLDEFAGYWSAHYGSVSRALAMMLSGKQPDGNSASGIAFLDSLCDTSTGYGFSQVFKFSGSTASDDRDLVAHELGHNFGSDHTHCYDPPIDLCWNQEPGCYAGAPSCPAPQTINGVTNVRGTLMSYCDNLNGCSASGVFHPRTVAVLNPIIASKVGVCVFPLASSSPKEASPQDDMRAQRGTAGAVNVMYAPACGATQHTVYAGNLSTLHTVGIAWSQRACSLGASGSLSFQPTGSVYFVVVGNNGTSEGSYGQTSTGERPPAGSGTPCSYTQSLSGTCP